MCENKRSSELSEFSDIERKRIRTTMNDENNPISCIEDFSNELLYEIFEYFDADVLYEAFCDLNSRFQHLLFRSTFSLKVRPDYGSLSYLEHYCKNYWIPNKHRIVSIAFDHYSLIETSLTYCMIDSSFHRLESIYLNAPKAEQFLMLLFYLKSLPRLSSLATILLVNKRIGGLGNIYRMIFSLPSLKYNKLSLDSDDIEKDVNISLPLAINESLSPIEYLNINHNCTVRQLFSIIDHTPQLRHLVCKNLIGSGIVNEQLVTLSHLKHLSFECGSMCLIEFASVVKSLSSRVEILNILHYSDEDYFDANRWKQMIENHLPYLHKFDYKYLTFYASNYLQNVLYLKINQFNSPFWIEQRWFFEAQINADTIAYSISSQRKRWFDDYEHGFMSKQKSTNRSSTERTTNIQLGLHHVLRPIDQPFFDTYKTFFIATPFNHLDIDYPTISDVMLVKIIQLLPYLDSIKVSSLKFTRPDSSDDNLVEMCDLISVNNKITKVCHKNTTDMKQVDFLIHLCRCMEHFQIHLSRTINLDSFLRHILHEAGTLVPLLRSLCLCIPNASEITIHQLQNRIESENLLSKYMIKRCGDYIYLQWN